MIYDTSNVASDTQIIEEFTDTRIHDVLGIDTDNNCIVMYARPFRLNYSVGGIETDVIHCEWINVYRNEDNVPNKFIFKRVKNATS